jgi:hypothetical protein
MGALDTTDLGPPVLVADGCSGRSGLDAAEPQPSEDALLPEGGIPAS